MTSKTPRPGQEMHRWHRFFYGPRIFHMTTTGGVALLLWFEGHLSGPRAVVLAAVLFSWAHLIRLLAPRIDPSKRGVFGSMFADVAMFGFFAPIVGWSWALTAPSLVAITMNPLAFGGLGMMLRSHAVFVGSASVSQFLTPFASSTFVESGVLSGITAILQAMLYGGVIAARNHEVSKRLSRQRRELEELKDHLEDKVVERTAALASTNRAISRFVPKEFLQSLGHEDVRTTRLGDVISRDLTILFADIRNFTTISEQMTAAETFSYLNECLSRLGPHIRRQSGFIDKYIGDAIMALFPRSPDDALRAATSMLEEVRSQNERFPDLPPVSIGIGIHFGPVMMGMIGEEKRFEATVISDAVNLTARLESLTKQLGCSLLVSREATTRLDDVGEASAMRPLGSFIVKGRAEPVDVFEVYGWEDEEPRRKKTTSRDRFQRAIETCSQGSFDQAVASLEAILEENPEDLPARWWLQRARDHRDRDVELTDGGLIRLGEK